MKFLFILTVWWAPTPEVFVMDHSLSGEDCIAKIEAYVALDPQLDLATPSCEMEIAR